MYPVTVTGRPVAFPCFFLENPDGRLAAMYFRPAPDVPHRADVLYIHPFCHELYNSRAITAMCFRRLAETGVGVLAVDLLGCGDSEGEFEQASWSCWKSSLQTGLKWLRGNRSGPISLCGMRLGGALALEISGDCPAPPERIVLLQPVISGEQMMTQYLRLRVAFSGLRGQPERRETTADLRQRIAEGESLEVAGYILTPQLVAAIDRVDLRTFQPDPAVPIEWLITQPSTEAGIIETWRSSGIRVNLHNVAVKPYWPHTRGSVPDYEPLALRLVRIFSEVRK